jgi:hypothetical protein
MSRAANAATKIKEVGLNRKLARFRAGMLGPPNPLCTSACSSHSEGKSTAHRFTQPAKKIPGWSNL